MASRVVRPTTGGFLRPFGCGLFIRDFLLGRGPQGSPKIDPAKGSTQTEIRFHYKEALWKAFARDAAEREIEKLVLAGVDVTTEQAVAIEVKHFRKLPKKLTRMRYHSFFVYFRMLKRLGWVEKTGVVEPSGLQEIHPDFKPWVYYRLTAKGRKASLVQWSNPQLAIYGDSFPPEYFHERAKRRRQELRE